MKWAYLIFFLEFLTFIVVAIYVTDNLPKTRRFIRALFRLARFKNFRRSADRMIDANSKSLAEKRARNRVQAQGIVS